MKRSLKGKLILSYLAIALITVLVVSALIRLTSGQFMLNMVAEQQTSLLKEAVQTYYTTYGTLDGFFDTYTTRQEPFPAQPNGPDKPPQSRDLRGVQGLVDSSFTAIMPTFEYDIGQIVPLDRLQRATPVEVNGKTIAWILPDTKYQFKLSAEEELFLQRTTLAIGLAALTGVVAAVSMGFILANRLLKPIRRLTQASSALAQGDLQQQLPVTSQDELGQLTATFNQMSTDLVKADQQRKRMTADITHDLSTPLQIISGYMEMLEEGEVALTPQRIDIIKTEIGHLRRLVGDLGTLAQADSGGLDILLQPMQPSSLLEPVYHTYHPIAARQGVDLILNISPNSPDILVDEGRMLQVLKNLVENALRYTPRGGKISLSLQVDDQVHLVVNDSGSGIDTEDLAYVFDRFYRADKARGTSSGKMGLGLAICKALVTAQNGAISVKSAGKDQGTTMLISLDPVKDFE